MSEKTATAALYGRAVLRRALIREGTRERKRDFAARGRSMLPTAVDGGPRRGFFRVISLNFPSAQDFQRFIAS